MCADYTAPGPQSQVPHRRWLFLNRLSVGQSVGAFSASPAAVRRRRTMPIKIKLVAVVHHRTSFIDGRFSAAWACRSWTVTAFVIAAAGKTEMARPRWSAGMSRPCRFFISPRGSPSVMLPIALRQLRNIGDGRVALVRTIFSVCRRVNSQMYRTSRLASKEQNMPSTAPL